MITCAEAVRQLWDYLENDLEQQERAKVEDHLSFCRTCCGEIEFAEDLAGAIRSARGERVPDSVAETLNQFITNLEASGA